MYAVLYRLGIVWTFFYRKAALIVMSVRTQNIICTPHPKTLQLFSQIATAQRQAANRVTTTLLLRPQLLVGSPYIPELVGRVEHGLGRRWIERGN